MASSLFRQALILFVWLEMLLKQRMTCTFTTQAVVLHQKFNVSITVPDTGDLSIFRFSLDHHNGSEPLDAIYIYRNLEYKLPPPFDQRMLVTVSHRTFNLRFDGATADLAGTYRCYQGGSSKKVIPDCGQLLIILRKPEKPTVVVQKKPILSETLVLECHSKSNSLPHDHNLGHLITWKLPETIEGIQDGRMRTNEEGHLLFANLRQFDNGLEFSCTFADKATVEAPQSDASDPYYIVIDNKDDASQETPFHSYIFITSQVQDGSIFRAALGNELRYTCHFVCTPACDVSWSFDSKHNGNEKKWRQRAVELALLMPSLAPTHICQPPGFPDVRPCGGAPEISPGVKRPHQQPLNRVCRWRPSPPGDIWSTEDAVFQASVVHFPRGRDGGSPVGAVYSSNYHACPCLPRGTRNGGNVPRVNAEGVGGQRFQIGKPLQTCRPEPRGGFEPVTDLATADELVLNITNEAEGAYRCTVTNPEGSANVTFHLQILN